jgi:hypothetical protein
MSGDESTVLGQVEEYVENGQTVVETRWFVWDRETGRRTLFDLESESFFIRPPTAISRNGNVIVGEISPSGNPARTVAARWTETTGVEALGILPGRNVSYTSDVSADGEVAIGTSDDTVGTAGAAIIWDEHFGVRELRQVLVDEYEMSLSADINLERGRDISGDRKSLVTEYSIGFGGGSHLIKLDWPVGPPTDNGDMNFDEVVDATDVDLQMEAIRQYPKATFHDLDFSGQVNGDDLTHLIKNTLNTWFGDANLDGEFNTADLVDIFQAGEYEDNIAGNSGWAEGDWDADGDFTTSDLTVAFQDGGFEQGPRAAVAAVPEPSAAWLMLGGIWAMMVKRSCRAGGQRR